MIKNPIVRSFLEVKHYSPVVFENCLVKEGLVQYFMMAYDLGLEFGENKLTLVSDGCLKLTSCVCVFFIR